MEKDYNLQCIDYAIFQTIERAKESEELRDLGTIKHLTNAILEYMFKNNAKGFSSKNNGRDYILQLNKNDFEEQLLKHVVKAKNTKTVLGFAQPLSFNKDISENLTDDEVQEFFYKAYGEMDTSGIKYILDKYPYLYKDLASKFIEERYFNMKLGLNELDRKINNYQDNYYYYKLDSFYNELRNENVMQYRMQE